MAQSLGFDEEEWISNTFYIYIYIYIYSLKVADLEE